MEKRRILASVLSMAMGISILCGSKTYAATTSTLTVDCSAEIREVTHCANGSLYGVTESIPGNINELVGKLSPNVFTNPARAGSGYQQPTGAGIPTAERLMNTSGKVMLRLADLCPNWPYSYPGLNKWLAEVGEVIDQKLASSATNFYGYEIWNEPVYTWDEAKNGSFNEMWKNTYNLIRSKDPSERIVGPSEGYYNHDRMYSFLSYCVKNNCVPDIICWHELSADGAGSYVGDFAANYADYRAIEDQLGISDRPISINEYCDIDHAKEGCPGSSACYIAKFERHKIDSACISWWWTAAPGRLGSLLATDSQKGAGWWFYDWYGDMSGKMVYVTPYKETTDAVDGFACVDSSQKYISCLLGGSNGGNISVKFNNLPSWIGSEATVKIEAVDWVNKDTISTGPYTISASNYTVKNGSITVKIAGTNSTSGYRIYIIPGISSSQTRYEAEDATISNANIFESNNASGGRFVGQIDFNDQTTPTYSYVDFLVNAPAAGNYTLSIRYANGSGKESSQGLAYNGGAWEKVTYPETDAWRVFSTKKVSVTLKNGINVIRLAKGSPFFEGGTDYAELDYIEISR